jgi:putative transposase
MPSSRRRSARSIGEAGRPTAIREYMPSYVRSGCVARPLRRVAQLMRRAGLRGCMRGRKRRTTRRDPRAVPAADLVKRNFCATAPDKLWTADITYLRTDEGFLHLAFVLDVYSRRIVGWSMAVHLRTELVVDALEMAVWRRKPAAGLVHHSDRGTQYTALSFGKRLEEAGIIPSMGRAGSALDNAISRSLSCPRSNASSSMGVASPPERQPGAPFSSTWKRSTTVGGCTPR